MPAFIPPPLDEIADTLIKGYRGFEAEALAGGRYVREPATGVMKVFFFITSLDQAGGTERVCSVLATAFSGKAGHQVGIISLYQGTNPFFHIPEEVMLFSLFEKKHRFKYIAPAVIWRLRALLKRWRPDVLINVNIDSLLCCYSLPALWQLDARNITWEHLNLHSGLPSRRVARALASRWADAIVTLTERDVVSRRESSRPRAHVVAIPNPSPYPPRMNCSYRQDARIVLAAGHLIHRKGFDLLLQAWKAVPPETRRGWRLRLVGSGAEGETLRALAATLGIGDSIEFAGRKEHMAEEYTRAGLFVLPSRAEGLPMVLLEAMAFGLPVVAYDCETGPAELVTHGKTGLLAPPEDIDALSQAISRMIENPDFRSACAGRALQGSSRYSVENVLDEWSTLFNDMSIRRRGSRSR